MAEETTIDPSELLFSVPTIPNELPPMVIFDGDAETSLFPIHEDDWSQTEFLKLSQLEEIKSLMSEFQDFEIENRKEVGWSNIFVRRFDHPPIFSSIQPKQKLLGLLSGKEGDKPIVHSSSAINGWVKNGFTIPLGQDVALYGYTVDTELKALGASLGENPDQQSLTTAFRILNKEFDVMLVDWRSQFVLTGVDNSGQVQVWRP